ncbi:MAG: universal stress protein [Bdellovibrionales bacterium]
MSKSKTVLWAVDPYSTVTQKATKTLTFIKRLASPGAKIRLSYVLSPKSIEWDGDLSTAWLKHIKPNAHKALSELKLKDVSGLDLLVSPKSSRRHDVERLSRYAKKQGAQFIVLSTHARRGVKRFFLGSFTEAALMGSSTPMLILNPSMDLPGKVKRIFVATDLSTKSIHSLKKQVPFLTALNAELVLFHKMMDPIEPIVEGGVPMMGGGLIGYDQFRSDDLRVRQAKMKRLVATLNAQGLRCKGEVSEEAGMIHDLIQRKARREKCQMIMTGTGVNALEAFLGGSVTRALARESKLPLFVLPIR